VGVLSSRKGPSARKKKEDKSVQNGERSQENMILFSLYFTLFCRYFTALKIIIHSASPRT
jgi:uncharacterized membrane protein